MLFKHSCYPHGSNAPCANTSLTGTGSCSLPQMSPSEKRNRFGNDNTRTYFVAVTTHSIFAVAWLIVAWYDIQSGNCKRRRDRSYKEMYASYYFAETLLKIIRNRDLKYDSIFNCHLNCHDFIAYILHHFSDYIVSRTWTSFDLPQYSLT